MASFIYKGKQQITIIGSAIRRLSGDIPILYFTFPRAKVNKPKTTTTIYDRTGTPV